MIGLIKTYLPTQDSFGNNRLPSTIWIPDTLNTKQADALEVPLVHLMSNDNNIPEAFFKSKPLENCLKKVPEEVDFLKWVWNPILDFLSLGFFLTIILCYHHNDGKLKNKSVQDSTLTALIRIFTLFYFSGVKHLFLEDKAGHTGHSLPKTSFFLEDQFTGQFLQKASTRGFS